MVDPGSELARHHPDDPLTEPALAGGRRICRHALGVILDRKQDSSRFGPLRAAHADLALGSLRVGVLQRIDDQLGHDAADGDGAIGRLRQRPRLDDDAGLGRALDHHLRQVGGQVLEIMRQVDGARVVGGIELAVDMADGGDTGDGARQRRLGIGAACGLLLYTEEGGRELKAVGDPVIDLVDQEGTLGCRRLEAVAGRAEFLLGLLARASTASPRSRRRGRRGAG